MNFDEALSWLYGFQKFGVRLGLERIQHLMNELGNPHHDVKIVHVAGTNGKGSVCKLIGSILQEGGYTVGTYLSPHLQRFSERMTINNKEISEEEVASLITIIKPIVDEMVKEENAPTFFEIVTTMAFQYFHDKNVDFAVIEVGLGGRYDATNVLDPLITVITNVSLEHEHVLGRKIKDIAGTWKYDWARISYQRLIDRTSCEYTITRTVSRGEYYFSNSNNRTVTNEWNVSYR